MIYLSPADYSVVDADFPNAIPLLASWRGGRILMMGRATSREVMHSTLVQAELRATSMAATWTPWKNSPTTTTRAAPSCHASC
jgi:hypothetical protein